MKIRIDLPDNLMQQANKAALEAKMTLDGFIENALRQWLAKRQDGKSGRELK